MHAQCKRQSLWGLFGFVRAMLISVSLTSAEDQHEKINDRR